MSKKVVEVTLTDGTTLIVHEPTNLAAFLSALPSLSTIARSFKAMEAAEEGIVGMPNDVPASAVEGIYPLLAEMAEITVEQFNELGVFDKMGVMQALTLFVPNALPTPRLVEQSLTLKQG